MDQGCLGVWIAPFCKEGDKHILHMMNYVYQNSPEKLIACIQNGGNVNLKDDYGTSILHAACGDDEFVNCTKILIENGASIYKKDRKGRTPLHWAAKTNATKCMQLLLSTLDSDRTECNECNEYINQQDYWKQTPLHLAATKNSRDAMRFLIYNGADPTVKDKNRKIFLDYIDDDEELKETIEYIKEMEAYDIKEPE